MALRISMLTLILLLLLVTTIVPSHGGRGATLGGRGIGKGGGGSNRVNPSPGTSYQETHLTGRARVLDFCGVTGKTGPTNIKAVISDVTSPSTVDNILKKSRKGLAFTKLTSAGLLTVTLKNSKDFARDDLQKYLRVMLNMINTSCGIIGGQETKTFVGPDGAGKLTVEVEKFSV
ncbi:unnamed protein product [Calypogeia fissa]